MTLESTERTSVAPLGNGTYRVAARRGRNPITGKFYTEQTRPRGSSVTEQDEYDVAVVVYGRSQGADQGDAEDRLLLAVRHTLMDQNNVKGRLPTQLHAPHPRVDISPWLVEVARLSSAPLHISAGSEPYRQWGMGAPRETDRRGSDE